VSGRELGEPLQGEVEAPSLRPFLAFDIDLPDPVFGFSGKGIIVFHGNEYVGYEGVAQVDTIGEGTDGRATGVAVTLNRVPSEFREDLADQAVRGSLYRLHVGALSEDYSAVIGVRKIWKGTLQSYEITDGGEELTVRAGGESRAIDQRRPSIKRFSDEGQKRRFEGDRFFEYLPRLVELPVIWAKKTQDPV